MLFAESQFLVGSILELYSEEVYVSLMEIDTIIPYDD